MENYVECVSNEEMSEKFIFYVFIVENTMLYKEAKSDRQSKLCYEIEKFPRLRFCERSLLF